MFIRISIIALLSLLSFILYGQPASTPLDSIVCMCDNGNSAIVPNGTDCEEICLDPNWGEFEISQVKACNNCGEHFREVEFSFWMFEYPENIKGFELYREDSDGSIQRVAFLAFYTKDYTARQFVLVDQNAQVGKTYYYYVTWRLKEGVKGVERESPALKITIVK